MGKDLRGRELGTGVSQRTDGYYVARFTNKYGRRVQKLFSNLKECQYWLATSKQEDEQSNFDIPEKLSVDAWYEYWIGVKKTTVRRSTVEIYKGRYETNIQPFIGGKRIREVTPMDCQRIFDSMVQQGYKQTTLRVTRATLHNMMEYACDNEVINRNPCTRIVKSNNGMESKPKEALTVEEQKLFCDAIKGNRYENEFRFLLQTGLRAGELIGLTWQDVDFKQRTISINKTMIYAYPDKEWKIGKPKTRTGCRTVPLTEEAVRLLHLQKKMNSKIKTVPLKWHDIVFLGNDGEPIKNSIYNFALKQIADVSQMRQISMHILRHTFATRCIEGGMSPKTLQMLLGHSNFNITMNRYVHVSEALKSLEICKVADNLKAV